MLKEFVAVFTDIGVTQAKKNAFSGESFVIQNAKLTNIHYDNHVQQQGQQHPSLYYLTLEATIQIRGAKHTNIETVNVDLNSEPLIRGYKNLPMVPKASNDTAPIDDLVRRLSRLAIIVKKPEATGKFVQLSFQLGGSKIGLLKEDMFVNQVRSHNIRLIQDVLR